jgi:hypothetical protein
VLVAKTLLSSATPEIEQLIEEVLGLDLPIVGVISDKQESICLAVQRKLPTVPHQICQYHYLKDVAQPVCEADRHFKKEFVVVKYVGDTFLGSPGFPVVTGQSSLSRRAKPLEILGRPSNDVLFSREFRESPFLDLSYEKQSAHPDKKGSPVPPEGPQRKCLSAGRVESVAV